MIDMLEKVNGIVSDTPQTACDILVMWTEDFRLPSRIRSFIAVRITPEGQERAHASAIVYRAGDQMVYLLDSEHEFDTIAEDWRKIKERHWEMNLKKVITVSLQSTQSRCALFVAMNSLQILQGMPPISGESESVSYTHLTLPTKRIV